MLPHMPAKPHITIVGAGNLAGALAASLHRAGYRIDEIVVRSSLPSLRACELAREVSSVAVPAFRAHAESAAVWFCVPDAEIGNAARSLIKRQWKGRVALHSSGALTSDALAVLRRRGATVASVHPLMTFVAGSRPALSGVPFAVEGDRMAVQVARRILRDFHAAIYSIRKRDKAAYHAWGTFASPLLAALLAATERVAAAAGVSRVTARQRMLPILAQTIANYSALGAPGAFSGPFVRGDAETVKQHMRVLRHLPPARDAYIALARAALRYLPVKNRRALEKVLRS